jgi:hypothetical protein
MSESERGRGLIPEDIPALSPISPISSSSAQSRVLASGRQGYGGGPRPQIVVSIPMSQALRESSSQLSRSSTPTMASSSIRPRQIAIKSSPSGSTDASSQLGRRPCNQFAVKSTRGTASGIAERADLEGGGSGRMSSGDGRQSSDGQRLQNQSRGPIQRPPTPAFVPSARAPSVSPPPPILRHAAPIGGLASASGGGGKRGKLSSTIRGSGGGRGKLGRGGTFRHRKLLKDAELGVTKPAIRRLARRG